MSLLKLIDSKRRSSGYFNFLRVESSGRYLVLEIIRGPFYEQKISLHFEVCLVKDDKESFFQNIHQVILLLLIFSQYENVVAIGYSHNQHYIIECGVGMEMMTILFTLRQV